MQSLSVVQAIFQKALHQSEGKSASIYIAYGEISEIDQHAIQAHWNELSKGTSLEQAQLYFRIITAEVQCMACFQRYHPEGGNIHCPYCGSFGAKILSGEDFTLEAIE